MTATVVPAWTNKENILLVQYPHEICPHGAVFYFLMWKVKSFEIVNTCTEIWVTLGRKTFEIVLGNRQSTDAVVQYLKQQGVWTRFDQVKVCWL